MAGINRTAFQSRNIGGSVQINPPHVIGSAFFVDSVNGAATNSGSSWDDAFSTVDLAIAQCTATKGDTIYMAPWHVETEAGVDTAIWTMSTAGVNLKGMRQGNQIPTFTFTDDGALASVTAANCRIQGCKFVSGVINLASALTLAAGADGTVIEDCEFQDGSNVLEMVFGITVATTVNDLTIRNCRFFTTDGADGTDSAIKLVGECYRFTLEYCFFRGDWDVSVIDGADAAGFDFLIQYNTINQLEATNGLTVSLNAATTGAVVYNNCHSGLNGTGMAAAGGLLAQNYETNVEGAQGWYLTAQDN